MSGTRLKRIRHLPRHDRQSLELLTRCMVDNTTAEFGQVRADVVQEPASFEASAMSPVTVVQRSTWTVVS